jgi:hypothetical protein
MNNARNVQWQLRHDRGSDLLGMDGSALVGTDCDIRGFDAGRGGGGGLSPNYGGISAPANSSNQEEGICWLQFITTQDHLMNTDARWQRDLVAALHLESLFASSGLAFPNPDWAESIKPTDAEIKRAVANIREWRSYLPDACVTAMIEDGWQWST